MIAEETVVHNSFGQTVTADVIEGAFEVLERVKKDGYRAAVIANADSAGARNIIAYCGLEDHFDAIIISGELGIEKPDKRIFQAALDKLGIEAEDAVMVGNRINADIVGANRIGMKSVWFRWNDRYQEIIDSEDERPDFTIKSLSELPDILSSI